MPKRVYFQIQYVDKDNDNRHSDGCMQIGDPELRKFLHDSLDEYLDNAANQSPSDSILDGPHFLVTLCQCHHETPEN